MRRVAVILVALAIAAVVVLVARGADEPKSAAQPRSDVARAFRGAPPALAANHRDANKLLGGGGSAFEARLEELRGHPVVVNKWASWCAPCRAEFPHFQTAAVRHAKDVAFVGLNTEDNDGDARRFLAEFPVPFPSYIDGDGRLAASVRAGVAFPMTIFIDRRGEIAGTHPGQYRTEADLLADIRRYAR